MRFSEINEIAGRPYQTTQFVRSLPEPGIEEFTTTFETDQGLYYKLVINDYDMNDYDLALVNFFLTQEDGTPIASSDEAMRKINPGAAPDPRVLSTIVERTKDFITMRKIPVIVFEGGSDRLGRLYKIIARKVASNYSVFEVSQNITILTRNGFDIDPNDIEEDLISGNII